MRQEISSKRVISIIVVIVSMVVLYPQWQALRPEVRLVLCEQDQPSCLKVSDFYAVQLTTYFLPTAADDDSDPKDEAWRYIQYCDRIQGQEKSFSRSISWSKTRETNPWCFRSRVAIRRDIFALVKALPADLHPRGVLTLDAIAERGKYLLKVAFGKARTKDEIIEMPILVGE